MNNNQDNLKEKFKHALISTARAISGDYKLGISQNNKNQSSKASEILTSSLVFS